MSNSKLRITFEIHGADWHLDGFPFSGDAKIGGGYDDEYLLPTTSIDSAIVITENENKKVWDKLMELMAGTGKCDPIFVRAAIKCSGNWQTKARARFTLLKNAKWDFAKCKVEIDTEQHNILTCFKEKKNIGYNFYALPELPEIQVNNEVVYVQEEETFLDLPFPVGFPGLGEVWWLVRKTQQTTGTVVNTSSTTWYVEREEYQGTTPPDNFTGWTLAEPNLWVRCPLSKFRIKPVQGGRNLNDVILNYLLQNPCRAEFYDCVRSDFLGFSNNGSHTEGPKANQIGTPYYWAKMLYKNLSIHQKSDVKSPDYSNPSTQELFVFDWDVFTDVINMLELYLFVDNNNCLRIEHKSYRFSQIYRTREDYTLHKDVRNQYVEIITREDSLPKEETFSWMDSAVSPRFNGSPIEYSGACTGDDSKDTSVKNITTDVAAIQYNNDSQDNDGNQLYEDGNSIDGLGFVIIANQIDEDGNFFMENSNFELSWEFLHDKLFRHHRYLNQASINGKPSQTYSPKPIFRSDDYILPFGCHEKLPDYDQWIGVGHPFASYREGSKLYKGFGELARYQIIFGPGKCQYEFSVAWACDIGAECLVPTDLSVDLFGNEQMLFGWQNTKAEEYCLQLQDVSNSQTFNFDIDPTFFEDYPIIVFNPNADNQITLCNTNYQFRVKSKCGDNDSIWSGWHIFSTPAC